MLAAAPGETLPLFPEPMHTFAGHDDALRYGSLVSGLIVRKPPEAILSLTISILCNTRSGVKTSAQQICS